MKGYLLSLLALLMMLSTLAPTKVNAVDISAGVTTWYTWLDRKFDDKDFDVFEIDPAFMYGPVVSLKLNNDFNLTFVYLYGKFDMTSKDGFYSKTKLTRRDSDFALNYRLNDYFKIFAGIKYIGWSFTVSESYTYESDGYGPGIGLSITYPIVENLFLLANISGIYLWGTSKFKFLNTSNDYKEYGINSNLSIAYYISSVSTTVSLGGRFQYLKSDYLPYIYADQTGFADQTTKFYGITLTATYNFSI